MSGQKKLKNATRHIKVVAIPSRKIENVVKDIDGETVRDRSGNEVVESVQLYKIKPMR